MTVLLEMDPGTRAERYEALLRAANAIASCSDGFDAAADALAKELREVVPSITSSLWLLRMKQM